MPDALDPELRDEIEAVIARIPLVKTLGVRLHSLSVGQCVMGLDRDGTLDGIFASLHGGILMTLADTAACFAIHTVIGTGEKLTTTDMSIRFLGPAYDGVIATATVVKTGRTLCPTEVRLHARDGQLLALAQVTYMRLPKRDLRGESGVVVAGIRPTPPCSERGDIRRPGSRRQRT